MNINEDKTDLVKVTKSILGMKEPPNTLKHYVTTIYWSCAPDTDSHQAGALAAERIEEFSSDCKVSDGRTEEIDNEEDKVEL